MDKEIRTRIAAFNIAARFEGRTYRSYQHDPQGILSYGRFNFSLASGALGNIIEAYVSVSDSPEAQALQTYLDRVHAADPGLRDDAAFGDLLIAAASDPHMQQAQDDEATARHWESLKSLAILPRGIDCALSWALLFDAGISFGVGDGLLRIAEKELGLSSPSLVTGPGLNEQSLIETVAHHYKQAIDRQAMTLRRPDLRSRGDFWLHLVRQGDWGLEGDANGNVIVKGQPIQVRAPLQAQHSDQLDPAIFYVSPTAERVRVRDAPVDGQIVTILAPGDLAEILDPYTETAERIGVRGEWLHLRTADGQEGYSAAWFYKIHQLPDAFQPEEAPPLRIIALTDGVRVRNWPVDGNPLATVSRGDVLDVLEPYAEAITKIGGHAEWLHVRTTEGITGYTAAWYYSAHESDGLGGVQPPPRRRAIQPASPSPTQELALANEQPMAPPESEESAAILPDAETDSAMLLEDLSPRLESETTAETFEAPIAVAQVPPDTPAEPLAAEVEQPEESETDDSAPDIEALEDDLEPEFTNPPTPDLRRLFITPTDNRIRIRAAPVDGDPVAVVLSGQIIEVLDNYAEAINRVGVEGEWLHIRTADGVEGYTAAWFYIVYEGAPVPMPDTGLLLVTPQEDLIRVRLQPGDGDPMELVSRGDVLTVLEYPEEARPKIGSEDEWLRVRTPGGIEGYVASRFFSLVEDSLPSWHIEANITGVNIDLDLAKALPSPEHLGQIGWLRLPYNVSYNPDLPANHPARYGNTDLSAAYQRYRPLIGAYAQAGFRIMLVLNVQTYGDSAGYDWLDMNTDRWQDLSNKLAVMAGQIAAQYKGLVAAYQIWDSMDAPSPAHDAVAIPAEDYAYMLFKCISAIRNVDRKALVLTGGHSADPDIGAAYAQHTLSLLPDHVRPDGIAFHPYGRGDARSHVIFRTEGHIDDAVNAYAGIMPGYPVWITEWGVLDHPTETPEAIARYAEEFVQRIKQNHRHKVAAAIWFPWSENMGKGYSLADSRGKLRFDLTEHYTDL